jgi:hypothetical protein
MANRLAAAIMLMLTALIFMDVFLSKVPDMLTSL